MTDAPLEVVAAAIAPLRPFADEVVIAVDARVDPDRAAAHGAFADRVVRVPYAPPLERSLAWLHAQCSGDWILRVDSDEIASLALAARLPELTRSRDVTHYWIPRRWLFPDRDTYVAEWPWLPDYQLRLVRNEPALLRFPGTVHTSVTCLGPTGYLREPIYHLDCVLRSKEERAKKANLYDRLSSGMDTAGRSGLSISEVFYLPERRTSVALAAVPLADRDALAADTGERFLAQLSPSRQDSPPVATREEVDRLWSQRTLTPEAYAASLQISDREVSIPAGELRTLDVDVTNRGNETWAWGPDATPPIYLSYELRKTNGQHLGSGPRTAMPAAVTPGATVRVPLLMHAPPTGGDYVFAVDLVHEHVRWFDAAAEVIVQVTS
jgi:hypothetical protein